MTTPTTYQIGVYNYTGQTLNLVLTNGNRGGTSPPIHISDIVPSTTVSTAVSYTSDVPYTVYNFAGKTLVGQTSNDAIVGASKVVNGYVTENYSLSTSIIIIVGIMTSSGGSCIDANGQIVSTLPPANTAVYLTQYPSWVISALKASADTLNTTIASFTSLLKKVIIFIMVIVVILVVVFGVVLYKKYKTT
jgi:hypothetical protein